MAPNVNSRLAVWVPIGAALLMLAGCNSAAPDAPVDPAKTAAVRRASVSIPDPRLPTGFAIYVGNTGQVREFQMAPVGGGRPGDVVSFSVVGRPGVIRDFYEAQAVAAGMTVEGRVSASDFMSVDARRTGDAAPRTFSAMAVNKGAFTNVTLQFDVVP